MPEIEPFAAIRYDHARTGGDLSALIAPPYDVLDQTEKSALLGRSERNVVAIDLPHIPPKSAGPAEAYQRSARLLDEWLADGTLTPESQPALYLYHQQFEHAGMQYTRRMFIARLRLQPFSHGSILPHEQTFGGPKEDRLALMKATKCQLSPIFGLYSDPQDRIGSAFAAAGGTVKGSLAVETPDVTARLNGVENRMWIVTDGDTIRTVASEMADRKVYIADGHHRYGTALLYREWFAEGQGESIPDDHPANYIMFVLAGMDDPGCLILPYHRVLVGVDIATVLDAWSEGVAAAAPGDGRTTAGGMSGLSADVLTKSRTGHPSPDIVLFDGATGKESPLRFTRRDVLMTLEPNKCPAWYKLDAAYLHRYLIDELLDARRGRAGEAEQHLPPTGGRSRSSTCPTRLTEQEHTGKGSTGKGSTGQEPRLLYVKSAKDARRIAREQSGVALLVNATPMSHLRTVSEQGGLMPQKSTYFHPKLPTGLTINPLYSDG